MDMKNDFTFMVNKKGKPEITVGGKKMHVVTCSYLWFTGNCETLGTRTVSVTGYLENETVKRTYLFDLIYHTITSNEY